MSGSDRERELLEHIATLKRDLDECRRLALCDELTGCSNRRGWEHTLAAEQGRCERHELDAVVIVIDLDGFKRINDRDGHHAGDALLRHCGQLLSAHVRDHDCVARTGGDEFAILAVQTAPAAVEPVRRHLAVALSEAGVAATVGGAAFHESDSLADAWRLADRRMLANKSDARATR